MKYAARNLVCATAVSKSQ